MDTGLLSKTYRCATTCAIPFVALGLLTSSRGRRRYSERFGEWGALAPIGWWLHGASVGEVQGLIPFIKHIRERGIEDRILLTGTSPTGLDRGRALVNETRLIPLDAPCLVARALRNLSFDRFIISETELWPELLQQVIARGAPCHIINGRVSDYTVRRYIGLRSLFAPLLARFVSVSVPDEEQRSRFTELGVDAGRIHVTGHTKYDTEPRYAGEEARIEMRRVLFPECPAETPIVVLGSVRPGEERYWFEPLKRLWSEGVRCKVIIAPRHAERFTYFWEEAQKLPVGVVRRSAGSVMAGRDHDVLVLDTMGELEMAYAAADLAFVGATLVNIGGHNPLEPAMYGVPVVVGPHHSVIREIVGEMRARGGICEVASDEDVYALLKRLCSNEERLREIGHAGRCVWEHHRGSSGRVYAVLSESEEYRCHSF